MKITHHLLAAVALSAAMLSASGAAQATLIDRGGGLIYDTDLNVTWLKDANLAATNTFGVSGINTNGDMTWYTAQGWIGAMNMANYLGYNDWRLPTTVQPDNTCGYQISGVSSGYNCKGSELGHLYYDELGNTAFFMGVLGFDNVGPFGSLQSSYYWSVTEDLSDTNKAWAFYVLRGRLGSEGKNNSFFALAVRPGDVATVPAPSTSWLISLGLLGLIGVTRRKAV